MASERTLQVIDLHDILRRRVGGWKGRIIPGFLISALERLVHQDGLNRLLREAWPAEGSEFARSILRSLGITVETEGLDRLPEGRRLAFASNHPLGGLDGIALIAVLGERYGDDNIRFLVNDMLMNVEPLRKVFLPVNKYGSQARAATKAINDAYASGRHIFQFPAGLVSRLHDDGSISDLEWKKTFAAKALEYGLDIVPVYFEGLNSSRFYKTARLRKKSGLKINLEQALLPAEIFRSKGKRFRIVFGTPLPAAELQARHPAPQELAAEIRRRSYALARR